MNDNVHISLRDWLDTRFRITARASTIGNEISSGTAVAMAMIYIIPVSSGMYMLAGENSVLAAISIAFVTAVISILMGIWANVPIALSTGMGINAFAVFTICLSMGYSYTMVMYCTLAEGIIFLLLSLTKLRSALARAIPQNMKLLIGVGIGGFLLYIGSQNAKLIVGDASTLTTMVAFRQNFSTQGVTALLAIITILIMLALQIKGVKANILIGMGLGWVLGVLMQVIGVYVPDIEAGYYSFYPSSVSLPEVSGAEGMFLTLTSVSGFTWGDWVNVIVITATMFYSDFFDTIGTAITCISSVANKMREDLNTLKEQVEDSQKIKRLEMELEGIESEKTMRIVLLVDAIGTILGALFRITTVTSFVESLAGNGRTGLSAIVTGLWFVGAIFLSSVFTTVPGYATGAALIVVGVNMAVDGVKRIDFSKEKLHQTIPGIFCVGYMVLTYNIANGMAWGIILYAGLSLFVPKMAKVANAHGGTSTKTITGEIEKAGALIYVLAVALVLKFVFL